MAKALVAARRVLAEVPEEIDPETGAIRKPFDRTNIEGRPTAKSTQYAVLDPTTGRVSTYVTDTMHCDLAWVCPPCMDRQGGRLYSWTDKGLKGVVTLGPEIKLYFATLTLRSAEWRPVGDLTNVITGAFSRMMHSKPLRALRASGYLVGWMRFLEFTTGRVTEAGKKFGTHPHLHLVLAVREPEGEEGRFLDLWHAKAKPGARRPDPGLKYRWVRSLNEESEALGVYPPIGAHPNRQHVKLFVPDDDLERLTGYLTKEGRSWGLAKELSRGDLKSARLDSMTPRDVLMAAAEGNEEAARWFRAYALATRDVRRMTQSLGYDGDKRKTFTEWAGELHDEHERREALIAQGIGDSDRAKANRQALADQQAYLDAMTDEEYAAYQAHWDERDRQDAAAEKVRVRLFDYAGIDEDYVSEFWDPRVLLGLEAALKGAQTPEDARRRAQAYVEEHDLPVSLRESVRVRGDGQVRSSWKTADRDDYRAHLQANFDVLKSRLAKRYPTVGDARLSEWTQERIDAQVARRYGGARSIPDEPTELRRTGDSQ